MALFNNLLHASPNSSGTIANLPFTVLASDHSGFIPLNISPVDPNEGGLIWTADNNAQTGIAYTFLKGDFNLDGQVTEADFPVMLTALTNIPTYLATHPLSPAQFIAIADFDGDNALTNRDLQGLLDELAGAGSGSGGGSGSGSADSETSAAAALNSDSPVIVYSSSSDKEEYAAADDTVLEQGELAGDNTVRETPTTQLTAFAKADSETITSFSSAATTLVSTDSVASELPVAQISASELPEIRPSNAFFSNLANSRAFVDFGSSVGMHHESQGHGTSAPLATTIQRLTDAATPRLLASHAVDLALSSFDSDRTCRFSNSEAADDLLEDILLEGTKA